MTKFEHKFISFAIYSFYNSSVRLGFSYGVNNFKHGLQSKVAVLQNKLPKHEPEFLDRFRLDKANPTLAAKRITSTLKYKSELHTSLKNVIGSNLNLCETLICA